MQKKLLIISWMISLTLMIVLLVYLLKGPDREAAIREDEARQRIEEYTKEQFRFLEDIKVNTDNEKIEIVISYVPSVGSFPIKQDIYHEAAAHAWRICEFYPEASKFTYTILWPDYNKEEVMTLVIDEDRLEKTGLGWELLGQEMDERAGFETHYEDCFSSIIETEESKTWRERAVSDHDSNVP